MIEKSRTLLVCSCEDSMPLDVSAIRKGCPGSKVETARHLCGTEIDLFKKHAAVDANLTVACTHQQALFSELLEEMKRETPVAFVNIRETAGWSRDAKTAAPKMAALLALGAEPAADIPMIALESEGVTIVYGRDEVAIDAARQLAEDLDITVLLTRPGDIAPPRGIEFPVFKGSVRAAKGHIGAFELRVDDFAAPTASSRGKLAFGASRDGAISSCDLIVDLSGGTALFPADDLREGYLRADPRDGAAVERILNKARGLVGTFDKPRYVTFKPDLCAHSRSKIVGCTRCLEVCPTGAIAPAGDFVSIDPAICAGCGGCASVCPTGAASYALPAADQQMRRIRTLLAAYHAAGGTDAVLLLHDSSHGDDMIHALSHHGDGLPANVLPMAVNETTQIGVELIAAAFSYGAAGLLVLTHEKPRHDETALQSAITTGGTILRGLGFSENAMGIIATDDPDALSAALAGFQPGPTAKPSATFLPIGGKRQVQRLALRELHAVSPAPVEQILLEKGAPFGRVLVDQEGCTLCLSCVSACPTDALSANPDRPELRFTEDLCVQCGLCEKTCPEKVISLEPRLDFIAIEAGPVTLKQEEPHHCDRCAKPFGMKSTIAKIREKLAGKHWMFSGENIDRVALLGYCDDCRAIAATERALDPYAGPMRPKPRTSEDYIREREIELKRAEDESRD